MRVSLPALRPVARREHDVQMSSSPEDENFVHDGQEWIASWKLNEDRSRLDLHIAPAVKGPPWPKSGEYRGALRAFKNHDNLR
jgi:hypothetical protein